MKKLLQKDYNPEKGRKNTKLGGVEKGYYKARGLDDEPWSVIVQKDSKVMMYLSNFLSTNEKAEMSRYNKDSKKTEKLQF